MENNIKAVIVDIDGTFIHSDHSYDVSRFKRILAKMKEIDCHFIVASGSQYYRIKDLFADCYADISIIAENGAFIIDENQDVFITNMKEEVVDTMIEICHENPEISSVLCGATSAYCEKGKVSQKYFDIMTHYYHRLRWIDDFKKVDDQILKFACNVPVDKTQVYCDMFAERLKGKIEVTTSGFGAIDLISLGCHKAASIHRLVSSWGISQEQCVAFGDGENDIEMLQYCGYSYAMANASSKVKENAKYTCPSNEEDGVLVTLEKLFSLS